jgi:hypothetical protein
VACPGGEKANSGLCVKTNNNENAVEGVLANNGMPFYIIAIIVVILGGLGFAVHGSKKMVPDVLLLPDIQHVAQFMLNSGGMMSEIVLAIAVITSGRKDIEIFGYVLVASRVIVGATPGVMVFSSIFSGKKVPLVDETTGKKELKYFINGDVIVANGKLYVVMLALSVLEPTLLMFLPWYETDMSRMARFPTVAFMKRVYLFETLQLMVTLAAQLGIIFQTQGEDGGTFGIIVVMNVAFSAIMLGVKGFDMFLKWGLLRGASKNEDCKAAQNAWKNVQKERSGDGSGNREGAGLELSSLYSGGEGDNESGGTPLRSSFVSNPMLLAPAATAEGEGEGDALLARFATREQVAEVREDVRALERQVQAAIGSLSGASDVIV